MRGANQRETFQGRSIVKWQLLPTVSHQSVSEGQWREYYDERRTIELDGLGANRPALDDTEQIDRDPRAEAILESARSAVMDVLETCGYDSISYRRSIQELVYLLPFTGEHDGKDPATIAMATVFYSPYETINYVTLSFEHHHRDSNTSTLSCEQSCGVKTPLISIERTVGAPKIRRLACKEALIRLRHFIFGATAMDMTPWTLLELLLCASAVGELGEDMSWLKDASVRDSLMEQDDAIDNVEMGGEYKTLLSKKSDALQEDLNLTEAIGQVADGAADPYKRPESRRTQDTMDWQRATISH